MRPGALRELNSAKIATRQDETLLAELKPTPKIIRDLRSFFPRGLIVGWKYELDGDRAQAVARGVRQIQECRTDACVVNGRAYGDGFGVLTADGAITHIPDRAALFAALEAMLGK